MSSRASSAQIPRSLLTFEKTPRRSRSPSSRAVKLPLRRGYIHARPSSLARRRSLIIPASNGFLKDVTAFVGRNFRVTKSRVLSPFPSFSARTISLTGITRTSTYVRGRDFAVAPQLSRDTTKLRNAKIRTSNLHEMRVNISEASSYVGFYRQYTSGTYKNDGG